jgi:hypothetical protein
MEKSMNIYFAGSIRGGRDDLHLYQNIIQELGKYGTVLTEHIGHMDLSEKGEKDLTDNDIFERDLKWLALCNVVVAELSTPSLGVGYEIARAELMGKKIIGLYRRNGLKKLSAMIAGNTQIRVLEYSDFKDAQLVLAREFNSHSA